MKDPQMFQFPNEAIAAQKTKCSSFTPLPVVSPRAAIKACLVLSWPQDTSFMNGIFMLGGSVSLITLDLKHVLPMLRTCVSALWVKSA